MSSRYAKEFHRLKQSLEKKTNGQASIKDWDPENITTFIVEVSPQGGPYKKGKFLFQIIVPDLYPDVHPDVVCLTDIYHPNIDSEITDEHNICLNLFDEWNKSFGLEDCVQGLIFLLYNPNLSDPISSLFDGSQESQESFVSKVQASLRGESFDGIAFAKNPGYAGHDSNGKEEKTGAMSAEKAITNSESEEPTKRQDSTEKEENEESKPVDRPPCTNMEPGDVEVIKIEINEPASPCVNSPSINSVSKSGDRSLEEQVNEEKNAAGCEVEGEKTSEETDVEVNEKISVQMDGERKDDDEENEKENTNVQTEKKEGPEDEREEISDKPMEKTNDRPTEETNDRPIEETKDKPMEETKDKTEEELEDERKEKASLDQEEESLKKETTEYDKAVDDIFSEEMDEEVVWNFSKPTTDEEEEEEEERDSGSLDSVSSDDDANHANFLPYEEPEFSWTEQELNEEQPYMDALGCRFLYPNLSDSSRDLSDYGSSEPDSDMGEAGYIFDYVGDDDDEEDGEGGGEVIELGSSRLIIRAVRSTHSRHRRREIVVVEEMEVGLRRNIVRALACLRPFHHLLWPNLYFTELSMAWLAGVWLFGSERRRITRRVLR